MSADRIVSFLGVASGAATLPRRVQLVTPATGWQGFVEKYIRPQVDAGCRRFLLWMPFGQETGDNDGLRTQVVGTRKFSTRVRFDQYQQAQRAGLDWLTGGFAEAIRPLSDAGCKVIAYTGTLPGAPEYERERWYRQRWIDDCLQPFKDANCDLAFDSSILAPCDHYCSRIVNDLSQSSAAKVYCESMPQQVAPHWSTGDVFSVEEQYQNALNPVNRKILVDPAEILGELVRAVISGYPKDHTWLSYYRAKVPQILADGHTACIHVKSFLDQGGKLDEFA